MTEADLASVARIADAVHPPHLSEPRHAFEGRLAPPASSGNGASPMRRPA
jgi:hypothetical protein